jgi:hypothetical protein
MLQTHRSDRIRFGYRCFDRILLNGLIQPFQQPERVVGFFATYRQLYPVSRDVLRGAAEQFQCWVKGQADKWNAPIVEAPKGQRDEFVDAYFRAANPAPGPPGRGRRRHPSRSAARSRSRRL